jgi:DNA polymerase III epsilon subunit-like protein
MIETTVSTSVLAFITAIDFLTGEVLINSYVAPTAPVTNWLTPVSGITPEAMDAAITDGKAFLSNDDARRALDKFLDKDTVVIGHALQHDLRALNLLHGRIVDTSVVTAEAVFSNFSSKTRLPRMWGLKTLAKELLGIDIQPELAHNPLEDALATREILIWYLRGPECLKAWAEKARSSYERVRLQRGENKKGMKNVEKKAGGEAAPWAKAQGKKRLSK